jgi:hypothetical protein
MYYIGKSNSIPNTSANLCFEQTSPGGRNIFNIARELAPVAMTNVNDATLIAGAVNLLVNTILEILWNISYKKYYINFL